MNSKSTPPVTDQELVKALQKQIADLRKNEAFFRAVTQNSSDIVIVVDRKAKILYVNSAVNRYLGYSPEDLIGKSGFDYILPADLPRALLDFGKALLTGETNIHNSFSIRHKDGSLRILEGTGVNLLKDPTVRGFVMNVQDVTDRRKAEDELDSYHRHLEEIIAKRTADISRINDRLVNELAERQVIDKALKDSETKYRDFLESVPIGVGIIDLAGKVVYINKRIEEFMGWSREEIIGKDGFGLESFSNETRNRLLERFSARLNGDTPRTLEIPIVRKNDPPRWIEIITTLLKDGDIPTGAQMVFVDVTARKEAEAALRKSEERFRTLIQRSTDVISILDIQGRFIYNSPSAENIFGYPAEFLQNKCFTEFIHPEDQDFIREKLAGLVNKTYAGSTTEFRGLKGDGTWRTFEAAGNNLLNYDGINGLVFITRDISERKRIEEEQRILTEKLHKAEKLESLGTLAGGVAHDLNNVLGVLLGYTQVLLDKIEKDSPLKKYLQSIIKSSDKASAIIQDLLTMARRGVNVKAQIINLNTVVEDFFSTPEFERIQAYHPHVTFRKILADDLRNLKGSAVHLGKAVMNLVSNAAEAIGERGEVTVTTSNGHSGHPLAGQAKTGSGSYIVLKVQDSGQGISSADIERIFEPFYTKKAMGRSGTGLGLAVVWGTVKDHEGYIDVQSEPDRGSTFTVYFPATSDLPVSRAMPSLSPESYTGAGESVLIVDDIREQRDVAVTLLTDLGYRVQAVASGEEAVDYLNRQRVDIVVLDMLMDPGMDGLNTYRRILEKHPEQKAIIVSGHSETQRVREAIKLGAGAYLQKPYKVEKIGLTLRKVLLETTKQPASTR